MLLVILYLLLFQKAKCNVTDIQNTKSGNELVKCVNDIVIKYFAPLKMITYVDDKEDDEEYLKAIHDLNVVSIMDRRASLKLYVLHQGYVITSRNYSTIIKKLTSLSKEMTWNPEAHFLIVVEFVEKTELKLIFDQLLEQHMNNVLIVNATGDALLYSYNPFDNYGCGKYYNEIISFGKCSQAYLQDLYPYKYVTGLRNCTFNVGIPNWPPYTIIPSNNTITLPMFKFGIEPYLLQLVGENAGFTLNITFNDQNNDTFSSSSSDKQAVGFLKILLDNEIDITMGGLLLTPYRAVTYSYIHDFLPYVDEIRFLVRGALLEPAWKYIYLEFDTKVWLLTVISLILYSTVMIILLRVDDKSQVVLKLLDNLLVHGNNLQCKSFVKCIFIIWVWCASLINAFYQSSLVSLSTNPVLESQISTEEEIVSHKLKPCFSEAMVNYYMESVETQNIITSAPGCQSSSESVEKVINSKEYYTIVSYLPYKYDLKDFFDDDDESPHAYALKKPYSKTIYCVYFYKGFPLLHSLKSKALRIREMGLVDKILSDMNYLKIIQHHEHEYEFWSSFAIPWRLYSLGCAISIITFVLEILFKYKK